MVSLLVPPVRPQPTHSGSPVLTPEETERLREFYVQTGEVLAPLTRVREYAALEAVLAGAVLPWAQWAGRIMELLLATAAGRQYLQEAQRIDPEVLAMNKAELLGEPGLSQFLGAFESLQGMTAWALPKLQGESGEAQFAFLVQGLAGEDMLRAQVVLCALLLILGDAVPNWTAEAVPLLCAAADEYMTRVEDVFFSMAPLPAEREFVPISDG